MGSTTVPPPITLFLPGRRTPEGTNWSTKRRSSTTMVCPAFGPPEYRATTSTQGATRSTTFPFPSSPHWAPTITMLGKGASGSGLEDTAWCGHQRLESAADLVAAGGVDHAHLAASEPRVIDHYGTHCPDVARVGERFLQGPAHDVPRHGEPQLSQ